MFRSYRPGYAPWHLTGPKARFLAVALRQAVDVARRFRDDDAVLGPQVAGCIPFRVPEGDGTDNLWRDELRFPMAHGVPPPIRGDGDKYP